MMLFKNNSNILLIMSILLLLTNSIKYQVNCQEALDENILVDSFDDTEQTEPISTELFDSKNEDFGTTEAEEITTTNVMSTTAELETTTMLLESMSTTETPHTSTLILDTITKVTNESISNTEVTQTTKDLVSSTFMPEATSTAHDLIQSSSTFTFEETSSPHVEISTNMDELKTTNLDLNTSFTNLPLATSTSTSVEEESSLKTSTYILEASTFPNSLLFETTNLKLDPTTTTTTIGTEVPRSTTFVFEALTSAVSSDTTTPTSIIPTAEETTDAQPTVTYQIFDSTTDSMTQTSTYPATQTQEVEASQFASELITYLPFEFETTTANREDEVVSVCCRLKNPLSNLNYEYASGDEEIAVNAQLLSKKPATNECDTFTCKNDFTCIPMYLQCNGKYDCSDGSDELNCKIETSSQNVETTTQEAKEQTQTTNSMVTEAQSTVLVLTESFETTQESQINNSAVIESFTTAPMVTKMQSTASVVTKLPSATQMVTKLEADVPVVTEEETTIQVITEATPVTPSATEEETTIQAITETAPVTSSATESETTFLVETDSEKTSSIVTDAQTAFTTVATQSKTISHVEAETTKSFLTESPKTSSMGIQTSTTTVNAEEIYSTTKLVTDLETSTSVVITELPTTMLLETELQTTNPVETEPPTTIPDVKELQSTIVAVTKPLPRISIFPNQLTRVVQGDSFEIQCSSSGDDEIDVVLLHNGNEVKSGLNEFEYTIYEVNRESSGIYTCLTTVNEIVIKDEVEIVVVPKIIRSLISTEGSVIVLSCGSDLGRWMRVNGVISEDSVLDGNRLILSNLKFEDSGQYECYDENGFVVTRTKVEVVKEVFNVQVNRKELINIGTVKCIAESNGFDFKLFWTRPDGLRVEQNDLISIQSNTLNEYIKETTLTILKKNDSLVGEYFCVAVKIGDEAKQKIDNFEVLIEDCKLNEKTCLSGQCIEATLVCNNSTDCEDGSDEDMCGSKDGMCEPNERRCRDGKCAQKFWFCDGESDCNDGSDEENCPSKRPGDLCNSYQFMCRNEQKCISKAHLCDGEYDCSDGGDEYGCRQPQIVRGPARTIQAILGQTITLDCRATGFPEPFVNWRLNWGHTCDEPRCTSTSVNGIGVLIIRNVGYDDAGAYSCEAINNRGRAFAIPDAILTIVDELETTTQAPCYCNLHSNECDSDGYCLNCLDNTYGDKCQYCQPGYEGDPLNGNQCYPIIQSTTTTTTTTSTRRITTIGGTTTKTSLKLPCFCNGLYTDCYRNNDRYYYQQIVADFRDPNQVWSIRDIATNREVQIARRTTQNTLEAFSSAQQEFQNTNLYFSAPNLFTGEKLLAYGGTLRFSIKFDAKIDTRDTLSIIIIGNGIGLVHEYGPLRSKDYNQVVVRLIETQFKQNKLSNLIAYDKFLMALSNVTSIMIRASFSQSQTRVE